MIRYRVQAYDSVVFMAKYFAQGTSTAILGSAASATWPANNRAIYLPVELEEPMIVTKFYLYNGATASGNVDIGLYSADGTRLVNAGTTAQSGTSQLQTFTVTSTLIGRGVHYLAVALSSTVGTTFRFNGGAANDWLLWGALQEALGGLPLPATATFASNQAQYLPVCGFR